MVFLLRVARRKNATAFRDFVCPWLPALAQEETRRWPLFSVRVVRAVGTRVHVRWRQVHALRHDSDAGGLHYRSDRDSISFTTMRAASEKWINEGHRARLDSTDSNR